MRFTETFWTTVTYVTRFLSFNPILPDPETQQPLGLFKGLPDQHVIDGGAATADYPEFKPPGGRLDGRGSDFTCAYPQMKGWQACSTATNRGCWIRHRDGREFNILTNYEKEAPVGIDRHYTLVVEEDVKLNTDGLPSAHAKLFNGTYPGPWIQACWGDTVHVKVINRMKHNGTSIHWHGVRMNQTNYADGVNGVTQCPIAPKDSYTYSFKVVQYGSSWYHSHYSVQYADGLQGPLTFHGPSSAAYDEPKTPTLMTDWGHNSAFEALYTPPGLQTPTFLLNGAGNVTRFYNSTTNVTATLPIPKPYTLTFERRNLHNNQEEASGNPALGRAKRYLLRLINTSFDTTFVFSIDNHVLQIVGADFVPLEPYFNTSVLVGIGQRYHVIVEARPDGDDVPADGNFWIRAWDAECPRAPGVPGAPGFGTKSQGYEKLGILRYDERSVAEPVSKSWSTGPGGDVSLRCSDETYSSLRPMLPWTVGPQVNSVEQDQYNITFSPQGFPDFPVARFSLDREGQDKFIPLQINFSDPIVLNLDRAGGNWPERWVVVPQDFGDDDWVYLALTGDNPDGTLAGGAHPIHLHGHDFALLQQAESTPYLPANIKLNRNNPPRRDVVLLPRDGFIVIAFKTDNPGSWLMHCHIAAHASEGLALQVLERQRDADALFPPRSAAHREAERVCANWKAWQGDPGNWWDADSLFQDDSGI